MAEITIADRLKDNSESRLLEMLDAGDFNLDLQDRIDVFVTACDIAPFSFVVSFLDKYKDIDVNATSSSRQSGLLNAVNKNREAVCKHLLAKNADPNVQNSSSDTPLIISCMTRNKMIATDLIKNNADIDHRGSCGETALLCAVKMRDIEMVKLLLQNKADINIVNFNNCSPLYMAIKKGCLDTISALLEYKPDLDANIVRTVIDEKYAADYPNGDAIKEVILEYTDKFNKLKASLDEFKKEAVIVNKARKIVKAAKIPKMKNVKNI